MQRAQAILNKAGCIGSTSRLVWLLILLMVLPLVFLPYNCHHNHQNNVVIARSHHICLRLSVYSLLLRDEQQVASQDSGMGLKLIGRMFMGILRHPTTENDIRRCCTSVKAAQQELLQSLCTLEHGRHYGLGMDALELTLM